MFQFSRLCPEDLERLRGFASLRLNGVLQRTPQQIESRWMDEVGGLLNVPATFGFVAKKGEAPVGFALSTPLPWESGILQKAMWNCRYLAVDAQGADGDRIAAELLAAIKNELRARAAEFLLCKVAASDSVIISALEAERFLLADTLLDFVFPCRKTRSVEAASVELSKGIELRLATMADIEPLTETARACFAHHFGRFHADPRIGQAAATRIYEEWIRSCVRGWADRVFVAVCDGRIAGFSAWKEPSALDSRHGIRLGHYSIGAVHPAFSGRGLFKALTRVGMSELCRSCDWIEGPTHHENHAVQRGYQQLGWETAEVQHSFHQWLPR